MKFAGLEERQIGRRKHRVTIAVGMPGQGKSTMCADYVKMYMKKYQQLYTKLGMNLKPRAFIHDPSDSGSLSHIMTCQEVVDKYRLKVKDPIEVVSLKCKDGTYWWKEGALRYLGIESEKEKLAYQTLTNHFRNGFVWFDEATNYYDSKPKSYQKTTVVNRRNYGWELFFSFHNLPSVPKAYAQSAMITNYILMKTGSGILSENEFSRFRPVMFELAKAYKHIERLEETKYRVQPHYLIDTSSKKMRFYEKMAA